MIEEVRHQVKRITSHPCIGLWAGNNENEIALMTNWYDTKDNITLYKDDYIKLYIDTIKNEVIRLLGNDTIFLSSSPTNGRKSEESDNYLAPDPGNPLYGDGTRILIPNK